jgi:transposase
MLKTYQFEQLLTLLEEGKVLWKALQRDIVKQESMNDCLGQEERGKFWILKLITWFYLSNKNQKIRKKWCQERKNWTIDDWKKVLWSDESPFVFRFNQRERVWKLSDEKFHPSLLTGTVKHDDKIMVWGCFCWYGTGRLYKVRGIMEKMQYKSILQREMLTSARELYPDGDFIFQQDNDPKHTSKVVKRYLEYKDVNVLHWPAQSHDLNPIENLWSILDKMAKDRRPQNEEQLFQILDETWKSIPINYLRNLVESMPRRCQAVLDANGLPTKY